MSGPLIDVHMHVFPSAAVGAWVKADCEIWEYGDHAGVPFSPATGELAELRRAITTAGLDRAVAVNCFSIEEWQDRWFAGLSEGLPVGRLPAEAPASLFTEWLIGVNEWLVDAAMGVPEVIPFVAIDPWVLPAKLATGHLNRMRERGARGVKLHPVAQRVRFSDESTQRLLQLCADLELVVLTHSGTARGPVPFAEPDTFRPSGRLSSLRLIVAHLGGGSWAQTTDLARRWPQAVFDLSEIIAWTGAPNAPSRTQLVGMIRDIGVERVLFGSDFPWYEPAGMMAAVSALPGLSAAERDAILGENAARVLSLTG
jgi:Predicted metal-dependent hydrolase of the TIM-barrel fold